MTTLSWLYQNIIKISILKVLRCPPLCKINLSLQGIFWFLCGIRSFKTILLLTMFSFLVSLNFLTYPSYLRSLVTEFPENLKKKKFKKNKSKVAGSTETWATWVTSFHNKVFSEISEWNMDTVLCAYLKSVLTSLGESYSSHSGFQQWMWWAQVRMELHIMCPVKQLSENWRRGRN